MTPAPEKISSLNGFDTLGSTRQQELETKWGQMSQKDKDAIWEKLWKTRLLAEEIYALLGKKIDEVAPLPGDAPDSVEGLYFLLC